MAWLIIVASGEAAQRAELEKAAREIASAMDSPDDKPQLRSASSTKEIRKIREEPHDPETELIIITASLPEVPSSPNFKTFPGLSFVKELQAVPSPPACILLSVNCEHRLDVLELKRCRFLQVGIGTR